MNQQHQQTLNANTSTSLGPTNNLANNKRKTPMCLVNELAQYNEIHHQYLRPGRDLFTRAYILLHSSWVTSSTEQGIQVSKNHNTAAAMALQYTQFKRPLPPTVLLNNLTMKRRESPVYVLESGGRAWQHYMMQPGPSQPQYRQPRNDLFFVRLHVGECEYRGIGRTIKAARNDAALNALENMERKEMNDNQQCPVENKNALLPTNLCNEPNTEVKSPISLLYEIAFKRKLKVTFHMLNEKGPPHMKVFLTQCQVGDFIAEGEGYTKKDSKERAAEKILQELKKLESFPNTTQKCKYVVTKQKEPNSIKVNYDQNPDYMAEMDPVSCLFQIQRTNNKKPPVYHVIRERDGSEFLQILVVASANGHYSIGVHRYERIAKWKAAEALLELLGYTNSPAPQETPQPVIKVEKKSNQVEMTEEVIFMEKKEVSAVGGSKGGQLAPGLLLVNDTEAFRQPKAILGRCDMLNSGSASAPTEVQESPQIMQSVHVTDQLRILQERAALEAMNAVLELNAESVHRGSTYC